MKPVLLSTTDIMGGACRGTYKLFKALDEMSQIDPLLLVQNRFGSPHPRVQELHLPLRSLRKEIDLAPMRKGYPDRILEPFSVHRVPGRVAKQVMDHKPDLVHLHWISAGFVRIEALAGISAPIVWTFRDMWPMTGGCHYAGDCNGYARTCGACPKLRSQEEDDLSKAIFRRKQEAWKNLNIHVIAPCRWMAECAANSTLFHNAKISTIPNGVNVDLFAPMDMDKARQRLGLPSKGKVLLFGADNALGDPRKGYTYLRQALKQLHGHFNSDELNLLVFGAEASKEQLGFPVYSLGQVNDDKLLRTAYCAADLFCAPSIEENMANTVLESLACGTPVAAFNIGGMPDMIETDINGGLAESGDAFSLARTITKLLTKTKDMRFHARQIALQRFDIRIVARQYAALYETLLGQKYYLKDRHRQEPALPQTI